MATRETSGTTGRSVYGLFEIQAAKSPDVVAIQSSARRLTYAELDRSANRIARAMVKLGLEPGDLVGILATRDPEMILGLLGVMKAGGVVVPLDPDYPAERPRTIVTDTRIEFVRLAYDVETTVKKIEAIPELDNYLGTRLLDGR